VSLESPNCEIAFDGTGFTLREAPDSDAQNAYPDGYDPADHPVKEMSWYGAAAYCDWLSMIVGLPCAYDHATRDCNGGDPYGAAGYRLPTDAEWEYATQFEGERTYPWGNEPPDCSRMNSRIYDGGPKCVGWTTPVGDYPGAPNIAGEHLFDMAGNLHDWINDWYLGNLGRDPVTDPTGPPTGDFRLIRGGGWSSGASYLKCTYRVSCNPTYTFGYLGFRCARTQ
jgi:formylglycine-generating enzyme required for sulfatase activity